MTNDPIIGRYFGTRPPHELNQTELHGIIFRITKDYDVAHDPERRFRLWLTLRFAGADMSRLDLLDETYRPFAAAIEMVVVQERQRERLAAAARVLANQGADT